MKKFARAAINVAPNKEREETARGTWHACFLPPTFHLLRRLSNKFPTRASPLSFQIPSCRSLSSPIVRVISRNSDRSEGQGDDATAERDFSSTNARCAFRFFSVSRRIQGQVGRLWAPGFGESQLSMDRLDFYSRLGGAYTRPT